MGGDDPSEAGQLFAASLITTDPPRHRQLRSLVTQAFTPKAVAALAPRISYLTEELLDRIASIGTADLIAGLAYPLPVIVIAELMGIPSDDRDRFKQWSDVIVSQTRTGAESADHHDTNVEMAGYFLDLIERRRSRPGNDLISNLLSAEIDGQKLSVAELLGFCSLLLVAGNETTTNLIGNAVLSFAEEPGTIERLLAEPSLLPQAIEEVLRYRSPVQSMYRVTAADTTLGGLQVPAGVPLGSLTVFDLVYRPRRTPLLERAAAEGCQVVEGIEMLIEQGARSFEIWTDLSAPVEVMREAAYAALTDEPAAVRP
jgi:cytochrome P450